MRPTFELSVSAACCMLAIQSGCVAFDETPQWGTESQEIVGGSPTTIDTAPWQVSLQGGPLSNAHGCGGSILSPNWIITAAHCVDEDNPVQGVAGSTLLSQPSAGQTFRFKRRIVVQEYNGESAQGNDIALLKLASPLILDGINTKAIRMVSPAMSLAGVDAPGTTATLTGWGTLVDGAPSIPDNLQTVDVAILSLTTASDAYALDPDFPPEFLPLSADQIPAGANGKDSCYKDSGGPLTVKDPNTGEPLLAGIVSWAKGCADPLYPGLNGRVSSFYDYVISVTGIDDSPAPNPTTPNPGSEVPGTGTTGPGTTTTSTSGCSTTGDSSNGLAALALLLCLFYFRRRLSNDQV